MNRATPALSGRALFAQVAPRLELAHRQRRAELAAERAERHDARVHELKCERLVAHRELQLLRAGTSRDRRYVKRRSDKLAVARDWLEAARRRSKAIGA